MENEYNRPDVLTEPCGHGTDWLSFDRSARSSRTDRRVDQDVSDVMVHCCVPASHQFVISYTASYIDC